MDAPLFVHEAERRSVAEAYEVRGTFSRRHLLDEDFEVIPTPGHTPGATAFLWDSGEHRLLFPGDTISVAEGEWVAAVSPRATATPNGQYLAHTDRRDARERIDHILEGLRLGKNERSNSTD